MKRNTFFRTIALGATGLSLQSSFAAAPFFHGTSVTQWVAQLRSAFGVKHRSQAKYAAENFSLQIDQQNVFLEQHGFAPGYTSFCFFGPQESYCFYPVFQRNTASGTTEILLPVFIRNSEGVWSHQQTLNGFQLEALCRAAAALSTRQEPLYALLMPIAVKSMKILPNGFYTPEGTVSITSKLVLGKVQTHCAVKGHDGLLYEETYTSKHCLS